MNFVYILSPTASGKSSLAHRLALEVGAEIISVDSMKVFRYMDIGTAKPSTEEKGEVTYHMLDIADPSEHYDVKTYLSQVQGVEGEIRSRTVIPIFEGGTALYVKCRLWGMFDGPGADETVRRKLQDRLEQEGGATLHQELCSIDPQAGERIHPNDNKRIVRALEVFEITGKPISSFQSHFKAEEMNRPAKLFGLVHDRTELHKRIDIRVDQMIADGLVEETRRIQSEHGGFGPQSSKAAGYRQVLEYIQGSLSHTDMIDKIKIATHRLARHQMTWFRKFPITWLKPAEAFDVILPEFETKP